MKQIHNQTSKNISNELNQTQQIVNNILYVQEVSSNFYSMPYKNWQDLLDLQYHSFIPSWLEILFLDGVTPNGFYDMPKPEFLIRNLFLH